MLPSMAQLPLIRLSITGSWVRTVSGWLKTRFGSYWPATGSSRSRWAKTSWKINASQNTGMETPSTEPTRMA